MVCPKCEDRMNATKWRPVAGIDPFMREYQCPKCGYIQYGVLPKPQKIQGVKF